MTYADRTRQSWRPKGTNYAAIVNKRISFLVAVRWSCRGSVLWTMPPCPSSSASKVTWAYSWAAYPKLSRCRPTSRLLVPLARPGPRTRLPFVGAKSGDAVFFCFLFCFIYYIILYYFIFSCRGQVLACDKRDRQTTNVFLCIERCTVTENCRSVALSVAAAAVVLHRTVCETVHRRDFQATVSISSLATTGNRTVV